MPSLLYMILISAFAGLSISFCCSLMEAALFAVPLAYLKHRADQGSKTGQLLLKFKEEIHDPIAAVLIFNTISHTAAAAIVGAMSSSLWGESSLIWVSGIYTLMVLFVAEIFPKQVGVLYSRQVAFGVAWPLFVLIKLSRPMIYLTKFVHRLLQRHEEQPAVTRQEMISLAQIGREEGVLNSFSATAIHNLLCLDRKRVRDILTPRVVVFRLCESEAIGTFKKDIPNWNYSRIPLYDALDEDRIAGFVLQKEITNALLRGEDHRLMNEFVRPLSTVPEIMDLQQLYDFFQKHGEHLAQVIDEHGTFVGLVSLEDLLEEIVGAEIVDESDLVSDLRSYAKVLFEEKRRRFAHPLGVDAKSQSV